LLLERKPVTQETTPSTKSGFACRKLRFRCELDRQVGTETVWRCRPILREQRIGDELEAALERKPYFFALQFADA
jgi:hypothetical protein